MKRLITILLFTLGMHAYAGDMVAPTPTDLAPIAELAQAQIQAGHIPGAVVVVGTRTKTLYREAFGQRALKPEPLPMTVDTGFDLASLTKVIATTTAVMQLVERRKLRLDAPVARYWPQFARNDKGNITVRQLLTHYSGLNADLDIGRSWSGKRAALDLILAQKPVTLPGTQYRYSDINFEILGELVRRVSGKPLDVYCKKYIFDPLGMNHTGFNPAPSKRADIAPTEYMDGELRWGVVHDPSAYRMGGVAGHAGLFSTADDLERFARMLLNQGRWHGKKILSRCSVKEMTTPQASQSFAKSRGLGWVTTAPFAANREQLLPFGAFGHFGYTGTMLWIDPISGIYIIVLSNRVHPNGKGDADPFRRGVIGIVAAGLPSLSNGQILAARPELSAYYQHASEYPQSLSIARVSTGLDVLEAEQFQPLQNRRVGVITNQTGVDTAGKSIVSLLYNAQNVKLTAVFSPEHGINGNQDSKVASGTDADTGLPVYSLYGETRRPSDEMLKGLDALVFDIQDVGARFYTYASTMAYAMEAAARNGIDFYVLDRPNPIGADVVQGPLLDADLKSFTGYFPVPVRHGMTIGELAELFNVDIGSRLHIVKMHGYHRRNWYDDTGLHWVPPSPNLRTLTETTLYPGVGLIEGANVSVGRGTDTPFELLGAPWIEGKVLADELNRRRIAGVFFIPAEFTPNASRYENQRCAGVRIILTDRHALDTPLLGIEITSALNRLYPEKFHVQQILGMVGSRKTLQAVSEGVDPVAIRSQWQDDIEQFTALRSQHLLY